MSRWRFLIDQPAPEVVLPNAIDDHPGGEGIVFACNPVCKSEAAILFRGVWSKGKASERAWNGRTHLLALLFGVSPVEEIGFVGRTELARVDGLRALQARLLVR